MDAAEQLELYDTTFSRPLPTHASEPTFDIGLNSWIEPCLDKENESPPAKRARLSLSLKKKKGGRA